MGARLQALLNKYLDNLTGSLFRDTQDSELCVQIILQTAKKIAKQKQRWDDDTLFVLDFKAKMYSELFLIAKDNKELRDHMKGHLAENHTNLAEIYREIDSSDFPRNEITKLYYIEDSRPAAIAEHLQININTVKYHLKQLKKRLSPHWD